MLQVGGRIKMTQPLPKILPVNELKNTANITKAAKNL